MRRPVCIDVTAPEQIARHLHPSRAALRGDCAHHYPDGRHAGPVFLIDGQHIHIHIVASLQQQAGDRVYFAYDSYELDEASRGTLSKQASWLQRYGNVRITVEGHADERGTREYNLALGDRRANAVKNYLAAQGVGAGRISTISYGKERPEVQGSDEESFAQNRRGVTVISGGAAS